MYIFWRCHPQLLSVSSAVCIIPQITSTHCNTTQHTSTFGCLIARFITLQYIAVSTNEQQHAVTHCKTL